MQAVPYVLTVALLAGFSAAPFHRKPAVFLMLKSIDDGPRLD